MTTEIAKPRTDRTIHRWFARDVERPLNRLHNVELETIAYIEHDEHKYPMLAVRVTCSRPGRPTVFVSGGVHGDEPAGVYAAIDFLEDVAPKFRSDFNFLVLPCVNPSGYEMDTLQSLSGANLNRVFDRNSRQPEIGAIEDWLKENNVRFLVTFDLHETVPEYRGETFTEKDNPHSCYFYETILDHERRIGRQLIQGPPVNGMRSISTRIRMESFLIQRRITILSTRKKRPLRRSYCITRLTMHLQRKRRLAGHSKSGLTHTAVGLRRHSKS